MSATDHLMPFESRLKEVHSLEAARQMSADARTLCAMSADDHQLFRSHRCIQMQDATTRDAAARNAACAGVMLQRLADTSSHYAPLAAHTKTWERHLAGELVDLAALRGELAVCDEAADAACKEALLVESDDGSSSASDYSSSETASTSDTADAGDEDAEDDDDEDDADDPPFVQRRRV